MVYFIGFYFIILVILGLRSSWLGLKFIRYCQDHYPEKAFEFLKFGTFTLDSAIFRKQNIDDPQFIMLKKQTRTALILLYIVAGIGTFTIIGLVFFT